MTGNWSSSDQILDGGTQGLSFFQQFIPVYAEAAQLAGRGRYRGINYDRDIKQPYDEQRGIDFSMLRADADHLRTAITNAENHLHNLDRYWGGLSGWTGAASNSARQFHDRFNSTTVNFVEAVRNCPGAITGAVTAIEDTLNRYVERVQDLQDQRCGGMTVSEVRSAIATARGDIEGADAARFLAKVVDASSGIVTFGVGWLLAYFGYGASAQIERCCQELMAAAKRALGDFIDEFDAKKAAFDAYTQNSQRRVQLNYDTMLNNLRPMSTEAFRDLPDPTPFNQARTTPQGQTGGRRTPVPTVGNGQTRPGSTVPQSGSRPTQPPQLPTTTTPAGSTPTLPTGTTPTTPPIAPQTPTPTPPRPLPVPPVTQPQQPQTVTIRNGASTITLSSPDSQGHIKLTVGDGTNPPKTYDVDFARLTNPSSLTGPSGAAPIPPLTPGIGAPSGGYTPTPGAIPMPPISGIGGSGGSGGGSPSTPKLPSTLFPFTDKPATPTHPDEDGKVVIHDGEVTITVEPDELTDQLKIQLDDGHGHTTSYRVDYHDPAHPTLVQDPNQEPFRFGPTGEKPSFLSVAPDPLSTGDSFHPSGSGMPAGVGVSSALSGGGGIGALSGGAHGPSGQQLEPGAYSQVNGPAAGQTTPAGATVPAASAPQQGGAPMGGGMPMGGMGAMQGGQDKERGGNRWLAKGNVIEDEGEGKRRAVKAGGVIGEDKKK